MLRDTKIHSYHFPRTLPWKPFLARFTQGECLAGARPAHARHTTFVLSMLSLAPGLSSPWEVPQVDRTRPQTFPARHLA